jgi:hypothetical protein
MLVDINGNNLQSEEEETEQLIEVLCQVLQSIHLERLERLVALGKEVEEGTLLTPDLISNYRKELLSSTSLLPIEKLIELFNESGKVLDAVTNLYIQNHPNG